MASYCCMQHVVLEQLVPLVIEPRDFKQVILSTDELMWNDFLLLEQIAVPLASQPFIISNSPARGVRSTAAYLGTVLYVNREIVIEKTPSKEICFMKRLPKFGHGPLGKSCLLSLPTDGSSEFQKSNPLF